MARCFGYAGDVVVRVLILGEGKSGTTALLRSVASALGDPSELFEPAVLQPEDLEADPLVVKKLLLSWRNKEARLAERFDKRIFIVRDPRDRLISHLLYDAYNAASELDDSQRTQWLDAIAAKSADPESMSFAGLLHRWWEISGRDLLSQHVRAIDRTRRFLRRQSDDFFVLKYEDYVDGEFAAVDHYLGLTLAPGVVAKAESRVSRRGGHGDWRIWFTSQDLPVFQPMTSIGLAMQGYDPDDWAVRESDRIDTALSVDYVRALFDRVPV